MFVFVIVFSSSRVMSQGGGCIEITSILVDACGSPEGENEMVLFEVGPVALNVSNMAVDWPNNNWLGLCQDASTAATVASINGIIQGCGSVTEPVGGVLPANAKVLLLTSTNINTAFNSFANLNDDLVVLFQCAGNTSGHFANFNVQPGLRTLIIDFSGSGGCSDTVTYDRTLLVNQFGVIGGFSFENDGAFVSFDAAGNPTYLNYGCQVLSTGLSLTAGPDVGICPGNPLTAALNGSAVNMTGTPQWSGGTGTFNPQNALTTIYTPGAGETGLVYLTLTGTGACNTSITDTVRVNIVSSLPSVSISATIDGIFNSNITDPSYFYNWYPDGSTVAIPGAYSPSFSPNTNGCYYMILSTIGGCSVQSNTLCITNVGVEEYGDAGNLQFFESPGISPWLIMETPAGSGQITISICDVHGRVVHQTETGATGSTLQYRPDWTGMSAGMYHVRISGTGWYATGKLMLAK
jgi:hypothetical protein